MNCGGAIERVIKDGKTPVVFTGYRVSAGQFVYSRIDARNGAFAVVPERLDGAVVSKDFPVFNIREQKVDPRYLEFFFQSGQLEAQIRARSRGATNRQRIGEDEFLDFPVLLPVLDEQRRIAAILDHATAILTQMRRLRGTIDLVEGSMYRAAVVGVEASASLSELVDDEDRINYGIVQPGEDVAGGVPMIRVADLSGGVVRRDKLKRVSGAIEASHKRSRLRGHEILVSCVGSIGQVALVEAADVGSNVARAISRVPIADSNLRSFVAAALRSQDVQRYWKSELRTVAQPTLNVKQLAATRIPLVARRDLEDFSSRMHAVNELRKSAELREGLAQSLVASLRARAFRGEL
ncbi:restriction endonuclease subunit S [Tsukamurella strandjordii]